MSRALPALLGWTVKLPTEPEAVVVVVEWLP